MSADRKEHELLKVLVREVREAPEPEVDWELMEQRLLARVENSAPRRHPKRFASPWLAPLAAGVLGLLLYFGFGAHPSGEKAASEPSPGPVQVESAPEDGAELQVGQRVVAEGGSLTLQHPGLARWTLAPASSGEIRALEPALVVQLQSGTLFAEVVRSSAAESFVVEVGGLRVAVHGTVFSVHRARQHAVVEVTEGSVVVGPIGKPATTLLKAPAVVKFVATGARAGTVVERRGNVKVLASGRAAARVVPRTAALDDGTPAKLRQEPTFEEVEHALGQLESAVKTCLKGELGGRASSVQFSLKTRVAFKVEAGGEVTQFRFTPPLAPSLNTCALENLAELRFLPSELGVHVIRDLDVKP